MVISKRQRGIMTIYNCQTLNACLAIFPIRYEQYDEKPIDDWNEGDVVLFEGELVSAITHFSMGKNRSIERFKVTYEGHLINVTAFNRRYLSARQFKERITLVAKVDSPAKVTALSMNAQPIETQRGIKVIYPLKEGVKQHEMHRLMAKAIEQAQLPDRIVPDYLVSRYRLMNHGKAILALHAPSNYNQLKLASRTLKYEEFLMYQCVLAYEKKVNLEIRKPLKAFDFTLIHELIRTLPYTLSADQSSVLQEILMDFTRPTRMMRLLQGDVGSGKTIVVFLSVYAVFLSHQQSALLVPTEILASQHFKNAERLFAGRGMSIALLTQASKDKEDIKAGLKEGTIDFVIGTHTLFQEDIEFKQCGFIITDEQHRFGVEQRSQFEEKGHLADLLMLSATPIPRTLANVLYQNVDVSTIETYPEFHQPVQTFLIHENSIRSIKDELDVYLEQGGQVYVVCASIDDNDLHLKTVVTLQKNLQEAFSSYTTEMLHGKMKNAEKNEIMERFNANQIQVLVSTTLIEVGVDVHNANRMVIYNAERFGLSTLHQLRGRIGRGTIQGKCYLLTQSKDPAALERLESVVKNHDGFSLSLADLKQRGPGDLAGTRQSGLPLFIFGDFYSDQKIMVQASLDSAELIQHLDDPEIAAFLEEALKAEKTMHG